MKSTPGKVVPAPELHGRERKLYELFTADSRVPAVISPQVFIERGIMVEMRDGVKLSTDHWYPAAGATGPTMLLRTPYGRDDNNVQATIWAERGRHVVVQQCRGTFESEGEFNPSPLEVLDGTDTLAWVREQPWCAEAVHSWGPSYLGFTQWAMYGAGAQDAAVIGQSARRFDFAVIYAGGGFSMENALTWTMAMAIQERGLLTKLWAIVRLKSRVRKAALILPPSKADAVAVGHPVRYFQDWWEHRGAGDPWWEAMHFAEDLSDAPPVVLVAGWQDMFLREQLADYVALREAGVQVRLIIGEWTHFADGAALATFAESFRLPTTVGDALEGPRVQFEVVRGDWRECATWPPPAVKHFTYYLSGDGALTREVPPTVELAYEYDPADPTPQAGGRSINPFTCGRRAQSKREARPDVLVFTGPPLGEEFTIAGAAQFAVELSSTNPQVDLMVRLCDVDEQGVSNTVADGYVRLPKDNTARRAVVLNLDPTAYRFAAGHRVRLQVSSGAHPMHLRNFGGTDPTDSTDLTPSEQRLFLGVDGCRLELPVLSE